MPACEHCEDQVAQSDTVLHRESTGFGPDNIRLRSFCSEECRARWRGEDPVLALTQQSTLAAWTGDVDEIDWQDAEAIAYSL